MAFSRISSDVVVIPAFDAVLAADIRRGFDRSVRSFPEFYHPPADSDARYPYVLGSFGAFRNPANFHCKFARAMRAHVHGLAKAAIGEQGKYFTQLFDSMSMRYAGSEFQGESWHRDSNCNAGKIWQGWVNLDDQPQQFRCVLNSALSTGQGFGREEEPPMHLQHTVEIPCGHMILFRQDILHCILKNKVDYTSYRQYIAFRISDQPDTIYDAMQVIADQSCPLLPSGEFPAMFSKNHNSALLYSHTIPWSYCIVQDWIKEPRMIDGEEDFICPRHVTRGLTWYGMAYNAYAYQDKMIMMPELI